MLGKPGPARQVIKDPGARPPLSAQTEAARVTQMAIYGPSKLQRERAKGLMEARTLENNRKCRRAYNKALRLAANIY
eukprot:1349034-Lingulodinium_polyedra.AAC.1